MRVTYKGIDYAVEDNGDGTCELWAYGEHTTYPESYAWMCIEYRDNAEQLASIIVDEFIDAGLLEVIYGEVVPCGQAAEACREDGWTSDHVASQRATYYAHRNLI